MRAAEKLLMLLIALFAVMMLAVAAEAAWKRLTRRPR